MTEEGEFVDRDDDTLEEEEYGESLPKTEEDRELEEGEVEPR